MKNFEKYTKQYFPVKNAPMRWTQKDYVDHAPIWCSVDLRDGNQALINPMTLEQKLEFFKHLVKIGFKEIEVGFPAASETEYEFCRALIEQNLIPDDVTIQVLTQSREHIIKKTFEALDGAKNVIVHLYNSTSVSQREQVFRKEKNEIIDIAVMGAELCKKYRETAKGNYYFEYSPESFTGTEPEFAVEICNKVIEIWEPTPDSKVIINLPVTVSHSMPHVYANQVEYMCDNLLNRENLIISLHPHNDRGCAVADSEMGLLAGADRIEGTLFGNGERTGNVDIVTLAMNMFSQGVDPQLNFENLPEIVKHYEEITDMTVYDRQPYSGKLVFAAFSGSHQDAIAKGMNWRKEKNCQHWTVPYLPIDPEDVGRVYEADVIRINSQPGKGGVNYILENQFGISMPKNMWETVGYMIKQVSDDAHRELQPSEVYEAFEKHYINIKAPVKLKEAHYKQLGEENGIEADVTVEYNGNIINKHGQGNGRLNAVSDTLKEMLGVEYVLHTYTENAMEEKASSKSVSYVGIKDANGINFWGVGIATDIIDSSLHALFSAVNNMLNA
ncbi:MAG: 2-isopropylmalate synthase [Oscillospiraceae bacterium]|nr:2-isopropylmalate synthase [Oscillospiraceae bacterium]